MLLVCCVSFQSLFCVYTLFTDSSALSRLIITLLGIDSLPTLNIVIGVTDIFIYVSVWSLQNTSVVTSCR